MNEDGTTIEAEYQGNDINVSSTAPLRGTLELAAGDFDTVHVYLDRNGAEDLLSALVEFLSKGEGIDAPVTHPVQ